MSLVIFAIVLHISEGATFVNPATTITCPDENCIVTCTDSNSCSNIDMHCTNNDYGCYIHCSQNACENSKFYFINSMKSDIICNDNSCKNVEIYIEPKNNQSTVFIDMQSSQSVSNIQINYSPINNNLYSNSQPLANVSQSIDFDIYPITILCNNSCKDTYFQIFALQYFKLYCLSNNSCNNIYIDFISYNSDNRGELNIDCMGDSSCLNANINAITANKFEMFCNNNINSCNNVLIQCPINSDIALLENSCIMDCENSNSCMNSIIYSLYGEIQLNNININKLNVTNLQMHCGYNFNQTCIIDNGQYDCNDICVQTIPQNNNMELVLPFNNNNNILQCNVGVNICIIYMNLYIPQSIQCKNSNQCIVVCIGINCGGINTNIDARNANLLQLKSSIDSNFALTDIYGPINGKFISNAALIGLNLYVTYSTEIKLICTQTQMCDNILIFANNSNDIFIECSNINSCKSMLTYLNNNNINTYCTRIYWNCNSNGCENNTNKLYINNELKCNINTINDKTYCNNDYMSEPCNINPLTTINNNTSTTNTVLITTEYKQSTVKDNNNNGLGAVGGIVALFILITCFCVCVGAIIITKNKIKKKIALNEHTEDVNNDSHLRKRSREDTIGSTVEDIINDSTAVQFKNPLENCEIMDIKKSVSPISSNHYHRNTNSISQIPHINHIIIHKPNMKKEISPLSDDEHKDEEKQIEFIKDQIMVYRKSTDGTNNSNNYLYSRQKNTIEGGMDMDDGMHMYNDELSNISGNVNSAHLTSVNNSQRSSSVNNGSNDKQRTFSNPSNNLIVLNLYNNNNEESLSDSDELYESVSSQRNEGGKNTTTPKNNNNKNDAYETKQIQILTLNENDELAYAE